MIGKSRKIVLSNKRPGKDQKDKALQEDKGINVLLHPSNHAVTLTWAIPRC